MIRFGPAGWSYDDWTGIVYPSPKPKGFDPLEYLAEYFDTIEVNSTFYRPTTEKVAKSWVRRTRTNPDFRLTAKLWKRFTHERKEAWSPEEVRQVRAGMDPLLDSGQFGALLLQFPWSFRRTDENREWLDDLAREFQDFPLVLEVRHSSWNVPEFYGELAERGIGFVNIDQPLFSNSIKPSAVSTAPVGYVRVHGRNYQDWFRDKAAPHERYDYLYTQDELKPWAKRVEEIASAPATKDVYVVTNNHYRGKGVANALMLESLVEGKRVPGPPGVIAEYTATVGGLVEPREFGGSE